MRLLPLKNQSWHLVVLLVVQLHYLCRGLRG